MPEKKDRELIGARIEIDLVKRIDRLAEIEKSNRRSIMERLIEMGLPELESKYAARASQGRASKQS